MHTIRLGLASATSWLRVDYALASISCEHCRSSRNHPHCVLRHIIYYCVTHFRTYLYRRKFFLVTDHKPLVWFENSEDPCSRVSRWRLELAEYDIDVV